MHIQILGELHLEIERATGHDESSTTMKFLFLYTILHGIGEIGWTVEARLFERLTIQLKLFKKVFFR